jgi:hypothetical protein
MQLSADLSGAVTSNISYSFARVAKMVKSHVLYVAINSILKVE